MVVPNDGRVPGLFDGQLVYAALDAIDQSLEQALTAPTEREQRWQLNQLRCTGFACFVSEQGERGIQLASVGGHRLCCCRFAGWPSAGDRATPPAARSTPTVPGENRPPGP
jgi:hypothetical protein